MSFFTTRAQEKEALSELPFDAIRDTITSYRYTNSDRARSAAEAYILKAKRENDKEKEWLGMESIGLILIRNRAYEAANQQGLILLSFARKHQLEKFEMRSLSLLGDLQMIVTSADEQLRYYNELLEVAEATKNDEYREMALSKIASLLDISGDSDKAVAIRKETISFYKGKPIDTSFTQKRKNNALMMTYSALADSYINSDKIDSAKVYAAQVNELMNKEIDSCMASLHYIVEAEIAFKEDRYTDATTNFTKAYDVCPSEYDLVAINRAYSLGKVAVGAENFYEAIRILQQGLDDYQVTEAEEGFMQDYYERLAEAYKHTSDFEKASFYFEKYLATQKEYNKLRENAKESILAEERASFKKEFDTLKAEKEEGQDFLNYVFLGASLIILILLFLLLKFYRTKKQNEVKFEALLAKIKAAKAPEEIINTKDEDLEEKGALDVSEEIKEQILTGLKKLEQKEYFLEQTCNSYNVAKKIGTNTSYLSKVINSHYGKNFNTYINDLRINYAIVRIKNDVLFRSYSIQSIAEELGYKSADSFAKYFKKDTGLNPSFYIKNIKNVA